MERHRFFIKHRLSSIGIFLVAAVLIIICLLDFNHQIKLSLLQDTRGQAEAIGDNAVLLLENEVNYLKNLTNAAAMLLNDEQDHDDEWILTELNRCVARGSVLRALFITIDGRVYTSYSGYLGQADMSSLNDIPFSDIKEPTILPPFYADNLQKAVFGIASPTSMGGRQGVLIFSYNVEQLEKLFINNFYGGGVRIGIVERDGTVVLGQNYFGQHTAFGTNIFESYVKCGAGFTTGSIEGMKSDLQSKINGYTSYSLNGEERYLSYLTTEIPDWYMMVLMPESALRTQSHVIQKNGVMLTFKLTAVMACLMSIIFIIRHREELSTHKVLQEAAMMDGLTHIYNRGAVELMLTDLLEKSHESSYALFLMDVDAFKQINDTYGHIVGDDVLIALAQHLRELFDEEALLGRMGGDEFIALLQYHGNKEEVICKAREITVSFFTGSEAPSVSVSIGISLYPEDGVSFHTLYQKADKALYDTKRQGKNSFTFYKGE